ncbi:MAG: hypothetical protein FGM47_05325 [Candidatus Nanopelagicaceae bacterium]|nr:hypothetical protein [Candidatus Nanopelagicaceae bacterium]
MRLKWVYASVLTALCAVLILSLLTPAAISSEIKAVAKKTAKPIPSPAPKWPPKGFTGKDGVFAKVPTSKELIGLLSAKRTLQNVVKTCEEFACGAVIAAAETGCKWWEVNSKVFRLKAEDLTKENIGTLVTYAKGSEKREQITVFLISTEPVAPGVSISGIKVTCHRDSTNQPKPGNTYKSLLPPANSES